MNCPDYDYLDWGYVHWPAFHLPDVFVVDGAGLLLLVSFQPDTAAKLRGRIDAG